MRFGSFVFPVSHDSALDGAVIEDALGEIELQDRLGFDACWLTEHHFDGACAYADPLVFAAAAAARTKRIRIGFAVLEMAFHHPVRLAAQTALLDRLSGGRIIVGTGRGSAFNTYEYIGFGVPMEEGNERLEESESVLTQAWSGDPVDHDGRFWKVAFPGLRPLPVQKPHPPLVRACISQESALRMARIGRPVLMGVQEPEVFAARIGAFRDEMLAAGFDEPSVEGVLDNCWFSKNVFVAEASDIAREICEYGFARERKHFREARERYNPEGFPPPDPDKPLPAGEDFDQACIAGSPNQVADAIAELNDMGVRNLMMKVNIGEMDSRDVRKSIRLLGENVIPQLRDRVVSG